MISAHPLLSRFAYATSLLKFLQLRTREIDLDGATEDGSGNMPSQVIDGSQLIDLLVTQVRS